MLCMIRPCFLVIDREFAGSISTRKLVIETAKFNVITAYSASEAIETLEQFPRVSGIVLDAGLRDMPPKDLISKLRAIVGAVPIVCVGSPSVQICPGADHYLEGFDPASILELLQRLEPEQTRAIEQQARKLNREHLVEEQ